jgi:hypothetical protein
LSRLSNATAGLRACRSVRIIRIGGAALVSVAIILPLRAGAAGKAPHLLEVPAADAAVIVDDAPSEANIWPDGRPVAADALGPRALPIDDYDAPMDWSHEPHPPRHYHRGIAWFGLRHSHTHGRHVGLGGPLSGSSWLNRPYYFGGELGSLWIMRAPEDSVSRDTDPFGGVFLGWDWDYYWGSELKFAWSTPELVNREAPDANRTDSLFEWSYSLMYYPLGDATLRPYWRWGIGNTAIDFPTDDGSRHDEWLLTMPIGVGLKYPLRRWLTARAEFADQLAFGQHGIPIQHNLTLTLGLECRFGARPKSYWPWYPSRHIW